MKTAKYVNTCMWPNFHYDIFDSTNHIDSDLMLFRSGAHVLEEVLDLFVQPVNNKGIMLPHVLGDTTNKYK